MTSAIQHTALGEGAAAVLAGEVEFGPQPIAMHASDATARELVATPSGTFGADLLRFPPGGAVPMHTHVGDHILLVISGTGYVSTPDSRVRLGPGVIYLVPSNLPHEITADSELVLIAIGNDRRAPASPERLQLVDANSRR